MWSYGCRPKDRRKNKGTSQWSLGCPNGKSWHIQYLMAWDIQSDDLIPIPILLPVNVDPLTRRSNLQTRQEEGIVTTIVSPYTKGWYDEGEATKKVGKVWEYQPDSGAISKTSKTWCYRSCFAVPTWLSGGTSFSDHPSQVPLPSVPFLFLTWIWSWRNWIGMIQGWLSYRMFPWLETTFPIWGQPRQGGPAYVLDMSSGNLPLPNGIPSTWHFWAKGSSTGFGVVFPSKIFGQTSSHPCSVKISEKQTSKQTSKLWDFNLWYLKNISYIKTHGTLELQTPSPPGQGSLGGCGFRGKLLDTQRAADSTAKRRRPGPAGQSWPGAHSWGLSIYQNNDLINRAYQCIMYVYIIHCI